jgi:hypothetical protein
MATSTSALELATCRVLFTVKGVVVAVRGREESEMSCGVSEKSGILASKSGESRSRDIDRGRVCSVISSSSVDDTDLFTLSLSAFTFTFNGIALCTSLHSPASCSALYSAPCSELRAP